MTTTSILKKLRPEAKNLIVQAVHEVLTDPDFGLRLSKKAQKRLRQASISKAKTIPFSEIKRKHY